MWTGFAKAGWACQGQRRVGLCCRYENSKAAFGCATVDMPVVFFVEPAFAKDPDTKGIDEITLSYTFYPVETVTAAR